MRRLYASLILAGLFQLWSPAPAQAWWEWLDELSGPKGLKGPQFEARLVCFGEELPPNLSVLLSNAIEKTAAARDVEPSEKLPHLLPDPKDPGRVGKLNELNERLKTAAPAWADAATAWNSVAAAWHPMALRLHVSSPEPVRDASRGTLPTAPAAGADPRTVRTDVPDYVPSELRDAWAAADDARRAATARRDAANKDVRAVNSAVRASAVGVEWSFCSPTKIRRIAIDFGITTLRTDDDRFADGHRLALTTVIPSVSVRVFSDPRYDVVDLGVGGGGYWFSSEGFASFSGVVLQPWKADFHAPSSWSSKSRRDYKRWLALPSLRLGHLLFPAGFEPNAFNPGPGTPARRIPGELVFSKSVFLNLAPLIRPPS